MATREHLNWLDTLKGLGILFVILGHLNKDGMLHDSIFLFHMPLFFFIGGLTYRVGRSSRAQFQRDARRLLIPYAAFLHLIYPAFMAIRMAMQMVEDPAGSVSLLIELLLAAVAGGPLLIAWLGVFWFITCFFLTKQAYHWLRSRMSFGRTGLAVLALSSAGLALAHFWPQFWLPWCADVVLVAIFFFWLGECIRELRAKPWAHRVAGAMAFALAAVGLYGILHGAAWSMNLKQGDYGVPYFSLALAGGSAVALMVAASALDRVPGLSHFLRYCGQASLGIMFIHQPVQLILRDFVKLGDPALRFGVVLAGSLAGYAIMRRFKLSRALYLGSISDQAGIFRSAPPAR